jgi:hypothetical protein
MTSGPDSLFSLGIRQVGFHSYDQHWILGETEFTEVFVLQMKSDGFSKIPHRLVESSPLCHHRYLEAFGNIPRLLTGPDNRLNRALKRFH